MATLAHQPHVRNAEASNKYYDPMHGSIFEVAFSIPAAIQGEVNGKANLFSKQRKTEAADHCRHATGDHSAV